MSLMKRGLAPSVLATTCALLVAPVFAQKPAPEHSRPADDRGASNWIAGASISVDNVDTGTLAADITGTIFYSTGVSFSTAFVGASSGFGTIAPAIDWGDGSTVPPLFPGGYGIPFDQTSTPPGAPGAVRAYRMAFSHAYAAPAVYTATINSHFTGGFSPGQVFTGTTTTAPTPSYATFGGFQTFIRNTAAIDLAPLVNVLEVPTVSELGLFALALILGGAGLFVLRR